MYDVIGDVHGHHTELCQLLTKMGYAYNEEENIFCHFEGRKAVFIGDFIDKGTQNLKVIELVRNMVDSGHAHAIMGNHDFNAVQLATPDPENQGEFIRKHTEKNLRQSASFLDEVNFDSKKHREIIAWFKTLPVYLSLENSHFVHACWYPSAIKQLQKAGMMREDGSLTESGWAAGGNKSSPYYELIEILLKGPEEKLGNNLSFADPYGTERSVGRIAWWANAPKTYGEAFTSLPLDIAFRNAAYKPTGDNALSENIRNELGKMNPNEFIFIGHIWRTGTPKPLSNRICCVDYSVAKGDKLAAYRLNAGDLGLSESNFVWIQSVDAPKQEMSLEAK